MESVPLKGSRVKTHSALEDARGLFVKPQHLDARKPNKEGVVQGWVPGHGGDVWWVKHDDGTIGAYSYTELEYVI